MRIPTVCGGSHALAADHHKTTASSQQSRMEKRRMVRREELSMLEEAPMSLDCGGRTGLFTSTPIGWMPAASDRCGRNRVW